MSEELINFELPTQKSSIIKVLGVGGGGSNAVNYMYEQGIRDVDFIVCNTDAQALLKSPVPIRIQLGASLTEGRGAGSKPEQGRQAAIENLDDVTEVLAQNTKMVFITAGMGGGTGTGAAPVIAKAAKEMGILTVGIVTIPFRAEGPKRISHAIDGISELKEHVDSLLVINNERLREIFGDLPVSEAWSKADDILTVAAKGIAEIITVPGHINVDFADVQTVMSNSGVAIMGQGTATGENRAIEAIKIALNSPLLNNNDIRGARNILLNVTSGENEVTLDEIARISEFAQEAAGNKADIILGSCKDDTLGDAVAVTVIATGFGTSSIPELHARVEEKKQVIKLGENRVISPEDPVSQKTFDFKGNEINNEDQMKEYYEIKVKTGDEQQGKGVDEPNIRKNIERIHKLGDIHNPANIDDMEAVPAYKRQKMQIDEQENYSDTSDVSKYSLQDEDEKTKLRDNNSFLHDNVD